MKNLIPYFIQHQFEQQKGHGFFDAYTMFIDLSGFTPLTETLMERGNEGAEELSIILNKVFEPMVSLVYRKNGFIPYFAGDAFTAIFPKDEVRHPWEIILTAQALRDLFDEKETWETRYGAFDIRIKIGLACGKVEWGIVGGKEHKSFYFRGDGIDACAEGEHFASQQEIIIASNLQHELASANGHFKPVATDFYKLIKDFGQEKNITYPKVFEQPLSVKVARSFLLESVLKFNQQGEFRSVITVFISFEGADNHKVLNSFVSTVVNEFYNFSGYFKEVDFGDKGGVMVGFFGAPISFENNAERALELVTAIQEAVTVTRLKKKSDLRYRIGITSGVAYAGIVGGDERCQYAVVGNRVNLAARLMMNADWGEVLVDRDIQKSRNFRFKHKGDISYKGIMRDVPTYALKGRNVSEDPVYAGRIVGRDSELRALKGFAKKVFKEQKLGLAYIYGEAGIGKSRISFELKKYFQKKGVVSWFSCQADQILRKSFNPFVFFLKNYFEQSPENSKIDNRTAFERRFQWLLNDISRIKHEEANEVYLEISRTRSILAAQIGIRYPDSLWEQLDAKGRYQNILAAIITIFKAEALIRPIVVELEDGHWFDEDSRALLKEMVHQLKAFPIFLLATSRYQDDGTKPLLIPEELMEADQITQVSFDLKFLDAEPLRAFVANRLKGDIDQEFFDLLVRSTNGNPFYAEQILEYFSESDLLELEAGVWHIRDKSIKVSSSINSVLMARIDRLSALVKETVKAAAVIGREFELPVLTEVMRSQHLFEEDAASLEILKEQIRTAEQGQIWRAINELRYIFKHSLLREAVYEMQLRTRLRELHFLIAKAIEKVYAEKLEEKYLDLSFHYEHADAKDTHNEYTRLAADYARKNFQNKQALSLYDKLIKNLKGAKDSTLERVRAMLKKAAILELIGEWEACEKVLKQAIKLSPQLESQVRTGQAHNSFGKLLMLKGQYDTARTHLEKAIQFFEQVDDQYGVFKVFGNLGNLYFRQGQYKKAEEYFIKSIEISERNEYTAENAQIVANLGLTYMNEGNYEEGIRWQKSQLAVCKTNKDKQGMATLYTNMGIVYFEQGAYDAALECYTEGLALSQELGNKQLTAIATGCIGSVYERKGDYEQAMHHFEKDLELVEELGDKQGIAITLGLIGDLHTVKGEFDKAIQFLERQLALCRELSYQKGIAKAVNTLGDIYFYKDQHEISVNYYDLAIEVTRQINNRLVLGSSLIEKGKPLVAQGKIKEAKVAQEEALKVAQDLGNPDLLFDAKILGARVAYAEKNIDLATDILQDLLKERTSEKEQADIYYELYQVVKDKETYRQNALDLYQNLYSETPQFLFRKRMQQLILRK
ncbi:MAG: tetratricopeptide repeat protein [Bacteroidota bacterium]